MPYELTQEMIEQCAAEPLDPAVAVEVTHYIAEGKSNAYYRGLLDGVGMMYQVGMNFQNPQMQQLSKTFAIFIAQKIIGPPNMIVDDALINASVDELIFSLQEQIDADEVNYR